MLSAYINRAVELLLQKVSFHIFVVRWVSLRIKYKCIMLITMCFDTCERNHAILAKRERKCVSSLIMMLFLSL